MLFDFLKKFRKISPGSGRSKFAFVSYDEADASFVRKLSDYLISQELPLLIERHANGKETNENCERTVKDCDVFLLVMSTHSMASWQVTKEIEIAARYHKLIIPISLEKQILPGFDNVQAGDATKLYSLSLELAELLRGKLNASQTPAKSIQKLRIEYIVILLFENSPFGNGRILYTGKKLMADHSKILNEKIDDLDELDWLELFVTFEQVFPSERYCQANYNSTHFPTLQHLVDYLFNKMNWEEIKDIQFIGF